MRSCWLAISLFIFAPLALAQFKWIDSSGRIGYGDKPPPGAHDIESLEGVARGAKPDPLAQLPYELQRTMGQFPVTLYTTADCRACDDARSMLKTRAVPFSERTVGVADDVQALKQMTGSDRLPALQVGGRTITGFNSTVWNDALDLAGYPRQSQLPANWSWAAPRPLSEPKAAPAAAAQPGAEPASGAPQ